MTKKELITLHSDKCKIDIVDANLGRGKETRYIVSFSLTNGELIALDNTLDEPDSPVGFDLRAYFRNAAACSEIKL